MDTKHAFRKSLLSTTIIAVLQGLSSGTASAGTCPPPDTSGNVHVSSGEFCSGGITVNPGGPAVNDIGLEGKVVGDIVNHDGMSDFWMDAGTLDGSFINNGNAQDVNIANGSEVFADIRNHGDMRYLTVNDGPATPTVVHGSIVNTNGIIRVHITGSGARVGGDIINADGAQIADELNINDGASVAGNVYNDGSADAVIVDGGSSVGGNLVNNGSAFGVGILDGSSVAGNFENNGDAFYFVVDDGSAVGGSMINTGNNIYAGINDGSTVTGDFGNEGYVDGVMMVDGSAVTGQVFNEGYTDGVHITDGSSVSGVINRNEAGFVVTARSHVQGDFANEGQAGHLGIYNSQIDGNVTNSGAADFLLAMGDGTAIEGDLVNTSTGMIQDGIALVDGASVTGKLVNDGMLNGSIQVVMGSSVGDDLVNNGDVFVGPGNQNFVPDGIEPMPGELTVAGINIDAGSTVSGNVVNNGNLIINFPPPPPPLPDGAEPLSDGVGLNYSLAGISVDHGSSVGDIVNSGSIEATAGLGHDGPEFADGIQANGIQVINGSTSGSIINDGAILADTFGIYVDGSGHDGVTVDGSVVNAGAGSIITQDNGIYIDTAEVTGDVVNEGVVHSSNDNAIDIEDSIIGGSVVNLGSLVSNQDYDAIDIDDTTIGGDVLNFGDITGEDGIDIDDSNVTGSVVNIGVITADDEGFDIDQSDFGGSLVNEGLITAGGIGITVEGEENTLPPVPDGGAPVTEIDYVSIGGDFINVGEIIAGETGISMEYVDIAGDFDSSGSIQAGPQGPLPDGGASFNGIELAEVNVGGNVILGDISASGSGVAINSTMIGDDFVGTGAITGIQEDAIQLNETSIGGSLINHGELMAGVDGIDLTDVSVGGNFVNTGDIAATNGSGITLTNNVTIGGGFTNNGNINAKNFGIQLQGNVIVDDGGQLVTEEVMTVGGDFVNTGNITTTDNHGIHINDALIDGSFTNTGDITTDNKYAINVEGLSQINGEIVNTGDLVGNKGIRLHGTADLEDGVLVDGEIVTVAGGLLNTGNINSSNDAIRVVGVDLGGDLVNTGDILNTGSNAIDIEHSIIRGNIINSGTVDSTDEEGLDIDYALITGSIVNTADGVIIADSDPVIIDESHIQGSIINDGTIIARHNDAIQIDDSRVDGSVINNGILRAGDNAFEIDGSRDTPVVIGGNLENHGAIYAIKGEGVTSNGSDGFDIDDLDLKGSLLNTGIIVADEVGFEVDRMSVGGDWHNTNDITAGEGGFEVEEVTIGGDWISTGTITAGENGFDVEGGRSWNDAEETPDGVTPGYYTYQPSTVGGRFVNSGDIVAGDKGIEFELVSIGTNGITEDGAANFENHGNITAGDGGAIDLRATTVAGDFISTGNLNAQLAPQYSAGDYYQEQSGPTSPGGQVVFTAVGTDKEGNAWFSVKNEGQNFGPLVLEEPNSGFSKELYIFPGQEIFITVGDTSNGSGNYALSYGDNGTPQSGSVIGEISPNSATDFSPPHYLDETLARGISLTGHVFSEGTENELLVKSSVGGNFINTGNISAVDQGVYIKDADIGGTVENTGDITSARATGIDISAATIGGSFINSGNISAAENTVPEEGDFYRGDWGGSTTPEGGLVLEARGRDEQGNAWFVVRNESEIHQGASLKEQNGGFSTHGFSVKPGEEVYINVGQPEDALVLTNLNGNQEVATTLANNGWFRPQTDPQHGISLVDVTVGGDFGNSGNIASNNHGINLQNMSVGGNLVNSGDISATDTAINIDGNVAIGGSINNSGDLSGQYGISLVSNASMEQVTDVDGTTLVMDTTDGVITVGGGLTNSGDINTQDSGIKLNGVILGGGIGNFGDITAEDGNAIQLDDVIVDGNIENHGVLTVNEQHSGDGIDIDQSIVKGSVINFGEMNISGTEGFDIEDSIIEGSVVNAADGVLNVRSDGFYIEDTHIKGSLVNHGTIVAKEHDGIDVQVEEYADGDSSVVARIDGSLISTGNITAGDNGFELDGAWVDGYTMETPDGVIPVPGEAINLEIGGRFYNSGDVVAKDSGIDLELVSVGANGVLEDGQANFENHGNITSGEDSAIKVVASSVAGDFLNTGDLDVVNGDMYSEGDQYRRQSGDVSPEGNITLTAVGTDDQGNTWFRIKNEGNSWTPVSLTEQGGGFDSGFIDLGAGQEVYITVGKNSDGSENYVLSELEDGPFSQPAVDGELAVAAADLTAEFQPAYKVGGDASEQRGISLASKVYDKGGEFETLIRTTVGGNFGNAGNINALDEGIYLNQVDVGGNFVNEGNINSLRASAIDLSDVTIGGNIVNTGNLNAGQEHTYQEGDSYTKDWDGTPSEDGEVVFVSQGVDENGNQWFVVRNEGDNNENLVLEEAGGDFVTTEFPLEPGQEVYINAGELEGDLALRHPWSDGVIATAGITGDGFSPEYNFRHGISVVDASVGGHFVNSGDIAAIDEGIYIENVNLGGQIENHGNITSDLSGIVVDVSTTGGGLINSGDIDAGLEGISITDSTLGGPVINSGDINSGLEGIYIANADLAGGVGNSGAISAVGSGIYITDSTLAGSVVNTVDGEITVNTADGDGYTTGMELDGVEGVGDFVNHGSINMASDGWGAAMMAADVSMDGVVGNTGTINASELGMALFGVDGATGFFNEGSINSEGPGMLAIESSIDGDIVNGTDGVINAEYPAIFLGGVQNANNLANHGSVTSEKSDGITAIDTDFRGDVINTGTVSAGHSGITLIDLDARNVVNTGNITAGTYEPQMDGEGPFPPGPPGPMPGPYGNGITLVDVDLDGVISNQASGVIDAASDGVLMVDSTARGIENLGSVTAGNHGLVTIDSDIIGSVYNNGSITAGEDAIRIIDTDILKADGDGSMMTGHIVSGPDGVIVAGDDGIRVRESFVQGNIENYGSIDAGENAIDIDNAFVDGNVLNAGVVTAGTTAIDIGGEDSDGTVYVDGTIANYGTINAGHSGIRAENVNLNGDVLNAGSIGTDGLPDGMTAGIGLTNVEGVGNLINDGVIVAGQAGGEGNVALGMGIRDSEMDGNVENNGVIVSQAYGIAIDDVEGVGSVVNSGGIQTNARGIYIVNSDLAGDIENSGQISSRNSAIYVEDGEASSLLNSGTIHVQEGHGIKVVDVDLYGDIRNSGTIAAGHHGISLDNVNVDGSVVNTGSITAGFANPEGNGIEIDNSTLNGEVANGLDGQILANAHGIVVTKTTGVTDVLNAGSIEAGMKGIFVTGPETSINGVVINDGSITSGHTGIELKNLDGVVNALVNNGDITSAGGHGIYAQDITLDGVVENTGDIMAAGHGLVLDNNDGQAHGLSNSGTIEAGALGMVAINTNVMGDVSNSGTIVTQGVDGGMPTAGMGVMSTGDGVVHLGSLTNSGTIDAGQAGGDGNVALGMAAINAQFNGEVSNSGTITSSNVGIYLENTDGITDITNSGTVNSGHRGISLINTHADGELSNSGTVNSKYSGIYAFSSEVGSVSNSGTLSVAEGHGIKLHDTDVFGGIDNSGTIEAGHHGISLDDVTADGGVVNAGTIMAGLFQPEGNGIEIDNSRLNGEVANGFDGAINAKDHGIVVTQTTGITDVLNAGSIDAGKMGIFVGGPGSSIHGSVINDGSINAGGSGIELNNLDGVVTALLNNGEIDAENGHGILAEDITLDGMVRNTGDIMAAGHGVMLNNNDGRAHGLINTGTIDAGGHGLAAINTDVNGVVANGADGEIRADGYGIVLTGSRGVTDVLNAGSIDAGMKGISFTGPGSSIHGVVVNEDGASITSGGTGIELVNLDGVVLGIANHGEIDAGGHGIIAADVTLDGVVENTGDIMAAGHGLVLDNNDGQAHGLSNSGTIEAGALGMVAINTNVMGDVSNSGTIVTQGVDGGMPTAGMGVMSTGDGVVHLGSLTNSGTIDAGQAGGDGNVALGMAAINAQFNGEVSNSGTITSSNVGIYLENTDGITDITNSGTVNSGHRGISLINTHADGELSNSGTVNSKYSGIYAFNSEAGSVSNSGTLSVAEGHGIKLHNTDVDGGIDNSGTIEAGHHGISLDNVTADGGVVNTGSITAGTFQVEGNGVEVDNSLLDGEVANGEDGVINAKVHGIVVTDTDGVTDLLNAGTIEAGAHGLVASNTDLNGELANTGTITTQGVDGAPFTVAMGLMGAEGDDGRVSVDSITNSGTINAGQSGGEANNALGIAALNVQLDGAVTNTVEGVIESSGIGIYLDHADGVTEVINAGTLDSGHRGISLMNTKVDGEFANEGVIDSRFSGLFASDSEVGSVSNSNSLTVAEGHGIKLINTDVAGVIVNTGVLSAGHHGISLDAVVAAGGLSNSGSITAGAVISEGNGVEVDESTLGGGVINEENAEITTSASGVVITGSTLAGEVRNSGTINTQGISGITAGLGVVNTTGVTDIINEGVINVGQAGGESNIAIGILASNVDMSGEIVNTETGSITSSSYGIYLDNVRGATRLANEGSLTANQSRGISVNNSVITGALSNSGTIDSLNSGIYMNNAAAGFLNNSGEITVSEGHGIKVIGGGFAGGVTNDTGATIEAGHHGISLDSAILQDGSLVNRGSINAGQANAEGNGMEAFDSTINGQVLNDSDGVIVAAADGIVLDNTQGITNVLNQGSITTTTGTAISAADSTINGAVQNQGTIVAAGSGVVLENINGVVDSLYNSGSIEAKGGDGIRASGMTLEGVVRNDSTIDASGSGIVLDNVNGATGLVNNGTVDAGNDGLNVANGSINGDVLNAAEKTITAGNSGIVLNNITGVGNLINSGEITAENGDGIFFSGSMAGQVGNNTDAIITAEQNGIVLAGVDGITDLLNQGSITTTNGTAIRVTDSSINGLVSNSGTLNAGGDGLVLDNIDGDITGVQNTGTMTANGDALRIAGAAVSGNLTNTGTINANAGGTAIVLDNTSVQGVIQNTETLTATGAGIDISADSAEVSIGGLTNSGTITAQSGPAVKVAGATLGQVTNSGTITGAVVSADSGVPSSQANRDLNNTNPIAFDFRDAGAGVNVLNDQGGIINGDVYGSDQEGDVLTLASDNLNQFTGDIYDVENINLTGVATLNNSVFSFNSNSTFTVAESGSLIMGSGNDLNLVGENEGRSSYVQEGILTADININERSYDDAIVETTNEATLEATATISLSLIDQDIRNLDTTDGGANMVVVRANEGITNNGANYVFGADSQSILLNIEGYNSEDGTESGATISIADLGVVAAAGGADSNASSALAALQGIDSAGLVELIESNPELYQDLWNGSVASLATLAEELVASPENGIAAGQAAQAEAVNTILTRIAELRTGASGISTGDNDEASSIRPDSLWIRAIYSDGKQDATTHNGNSFNSYALRSKGFTIGVDKDVSDTLTLGVGASVVTSTANEKGNSPQRANSETNTYLGSLYAGWRDQDYFADASINFGKGKTDLKAASWEADYDSTQIGVSVLAGKSFLFNNNDSLIEPRVGFNYTRLETDEYSYTGTAGRETVGSQNLETIELGAGARFITGIEVGDGLLLPEASVMAWHDFKGDEVKADVEFETGGGSFTYFGPEAVKTRYQAGVGAEYLMDNNFTVSVNYEHNWQSGFKADTWVAKLRYDF